MKARRSDGFCSVLQFSADPGSQSAASVQLAAIAKLLAQIGAAYPPLWTSCTDIVYKDQPQQS